MAAKSCVSALALPRIFSHFRRKQTASKQMAAFGRGESGREYGV
jgi:hypothetical protein